MPEMILQRDRVVHTTSGHSIAFKKGEPVFVPPIAISDCMAIGAVPTEELPQEPEPTLPPVITDPVERKAAIIGAFEALRQRNARGDFDAAGKPHPKAVTEVVGFTVDAKERNAVWAAYMEESAQ